MKKTAAYACIWNYQHTIHLNKLYVQQHIYNYFWVSVKTECFSRTSKGPIKKVKILIILPLCYTVMCQNKSQIKLAAVYEQDMEFILFVGNIKYVLLKCKNPHFKKNLCLPKGSKSVQLNGFLLTMLLCKNKRPGEMPPWSQHSRLVWWMFTKLKIFLAPKVLCNTIMCTYRHCKAPSVQKGGSATHSHR